MALYYRNFLNEGLLSFRPHRVCLERLWYRSWKTDFKAFPGIIRIFILTKHSNGMLLRYAWMNEWNDEDDFYHLRVILYINQWNVLRRVSDKPLWNQRTCLFSWSSSWLLWVSFDNCKLHLFRLPGVFFYLSLKFRGLPASNMLNIRS